MRSRKFLSTILVSIGIMIILLSPVSIMGQGKGKGGGGYFGGMSKDRDNRDNQIFDWLSKGRGFFLASETRGMRESLTQFLQEKGITNDQVTRELYVAFSEQRKANFGGFGSGGYRASLLPAQGTDNPNAVAVAPNQNEALLQWAESEFKRRDQNGDGFLNMDEMPEALKSELGKWDANRDNLLSLDEFKAYFVARFQARRGGDLDKPANSVTIIIDEDALDKRPVVFRAGKLPKELPKWFTDLDTDKDGQVSLYEWRKGGKELEEFKTWDRDDDGLLTAEEVLFRQREVQLTAVKTEGEKSVSPGVIFGGGDGNIRSFFGAGDNGKGRFGGGGNGKGKIGGAPSKFRGFQKAQ